MGPGEGRDEASRRGRSAKCGRAKTSCNSSISGATPSDQAPGLNSAFCIASAAGPPRFCSIDCQVSAQADQMSSEVPHAAPKGCHGTAELAASPDPAADAGFLELGPLLIAALPLSESNGRRWPGRAAPLVPA